MDQAEKDSIELEVRRLLAAEQTELRKQWSEEASGFRDFLQRQFRYITFGVSTFAFVGVGLFVWFFSDSVSKTQAQMEATVNARMLEYVIDEELKAQLAALVDLRVNSEATDDQIAEKAKEKLESNETRDQIANLVKERTKDDETTREIRKRVDTQVDDVLTGEIENRVSALVEERLQKIDDLDVDALVQRIGLPGGVVIASSVTCAKLPGSWSDFEEARGRVLLGANDEFSIETTGGSKESRLVVANMPKHSHGVNMPKVSGIGGTHGAAAAGNRGRQGYKTSDSGEGRSFTNMPPYIALYFCRKD